MNTRKNIRRLSSFIGVHEYFALLSICLLISDNTASQDIHFSQFYISQLALNPAVAGAYKDLSASVDYRDQWRSVSSPYKTFAASVDTKLLRRKWKSAFLGLGLNVYNDRAGDGSLSTTQVDLSLAAHVKIDQHQLFSAALQGGFGQRSINYSVLSWGSQYNGSILDAALPSGEPASMAGFVYPDLGAGVLYQYNKKEGSVIGDNNLRGDLGFSVSHVTEPDISFYAGDNDQLYLKYVGHGSMLIDLEDSPISFSPGFVYYAQGPSREFMVGSLIHYTLKEESKYTSYVNGASLAVGAYYRWNDALVIAGLVELSNFAIGFSYDVNVSQLHAASNGLGGSEITLRYVNPGSFKYINKVRF